MIAFTATFGSRVYIIVIGLPSLVTEGSDELECHRDQCGHYFIVDMEDSREKYGTALTVGVHS